MNITISSKAAEWYKEEMNLKDGDNLRFFARYGGFSPVQNGFSLGISTDQPVKPGPTTQKIGITFYVEESDEWYFDGHDLEVSYNEKYQEPELKYNK